MNIVRMAMISPSIVGDGRAFFRGRPTIAKRPAQAKRVVRGGASRAPRAGGRRALIEAYPIVGIALFLAYFAWLLASQLYVAR